MVPGRRLPSGTHAADIGVTCHLVVTVGSWNRVVVVRFGLCVGYILSPLSE